MTGGRDTWKSRFGFIMTTAGFAIGLGNIWRFPYIMGQNGGGAFLIIYLAIAILIALPLLTMEMSLGRKIQSTPIAGIKKHVPGSGWAWIGYVGMMATTLMMCYYVMIMAWVLIYGFNLLKGSFANIEPVQMEGQFDAITGSSRLVFLLTTSIFVVVYFVISRGLQNGLERISKACMPVLLIMFVVLAIWANTLEGSVSGLKFYLWPDFSKITPVSLLDAMGQVFYSVGVGMAIAFVFGSYLHPQKSNVPYSAALVVLFDTSIALLAGLIIFPALFAFGLDPDSGFGLLFVTITNLFLAVPFGEWIGSLFYLLVFLAGLTSILSAVEGMVATFMDSLKWSRQKTLFSICTCLLLLSVPNILSFGILDSIIVFGKSIFGMFDFLSGNVFLPICALLISIYVARVWKFSNFKKETNVGARIIMVSRYWSILVKYIIPIAIATILIYGLYSSL